VSTTRDQRVYAMYRAMKRHGEFHYDGQSPYYWIARRFRMPIIQVRGIVAEMRQRRAEYLARKEGIS
jgi:hypothetical protein